MPISDMNWVFNEKPLNHDHVKDIFEIKEYYHRINLRFWWWVYPRGQSSETKRILQDAGLYLFAKVPCLAATLNESLLDDNPTDDIKILQVRSHEDLLNWKNVSFDGFEMPACAREQYDAFISSFTLDDQSPQKLFMAYLDEKPVATSLLFTHKGTAGIYYVSTLPPYRNRGCGLKITQAAMQSAKQSGYVEVVLQATPLGVRVYQRAGFQEYCQAEIYKLKAS